MIPHAGTPAGMKSPEFQEKLAKGPIAVVTVIPSGPLSMGKSLVQWFVYCLVVSIFAAYVASRAVDPGDQYLAVFRFAGVTAFAGYGLALLQNSIWWSRKWSSTLKSVFDALLYSLVTAGTFGWLWPS
jgi:O-antigen ligase